jgi:hypothetical protein
VKHTEFFLSTQTHAVNNTALGKNCNLLQQNYGANRLHTPPPGLSQQMNDCTQLSRDTIDLYELSE